MRFLPIRLPYREQVASHVEIAPYVVKEGLHIESDEEAKKEEVLAKKREKVSRDSIFKTISICILLIAHVIVNCTIVLVRSEEHTSELQSLMRISYAVFCLKKQKSSSNTSNK